MEFKDPPTAFRPRRRPTEKWDKIRDELVKNPNQWGLIGNFSLGVGTHIRQGRYGSLIPQSVSTDEGRAEYMKKHWEVATRRTGTTNDVYIRWIGEGCDCGA